MAPNILKITESKNTDYAEWSISESGIISVDYRQAGKGGDIFNYLKYYSVPSSIIIHQISWFIFVY